MMKPIQKIRGAILVMAALMLVLLIGVAALALDLGRLFVLHTEMQNAVDAAVLSAAAELDGETGARADAMTAANQDMLNHLAHFSREGELLENLQPDNFTFYSWIGSKYDPAVSPCGAVLPEKCEATGDDDASYVQIELEPADVSDDHYKIDLYFLPVLSLFGPPTAITASTRVVALAGSHYEVCNYPPMMICDPTGGATGELDTGDLVKLKEYQSGATWAPGTFGWLIPTRVDKDTGDDSLVSNKLLARRLGSIYGQECAPAEIEVKTGNIANWPRWGLNTRFGIYDKIPDEDDEDGNAIFPSAPNVVDYPRDDDLTEPGAPCTDNDERFGDGDWDLSECNTAADKQPSTFDREDYKDNFLGVADPDDWATATRLEYYNWELSNGLAEANADVLDNIHPEEVQCDDKAKKSCRMLNGTPFSGVNYDNDDPDKRRELFVAVVDCADPDFSTSKVMNMDEVGGKWMKFFMTEHVNPPSTAEGEGLTVYAEFIEEVTDIDDEHFRKVIQLYE